MVNSFLTAKPWNVIAKLSYCIYMFHYMVVIIWEQSWKANFYADYWSLGPGSQKFGSYRLKNAARFNNSESMVFLTTKSISCRGPVFVPYKRPL